MMLVTQRLWMEYPDYSDAALFCEWLNDPDVVKYSEQRHQKHTRASQARYWDSFTFPSFAATIHLKEPETPIGSVSVHIDQPNLIADVGIMIGAKAVWGKGYGYEVWERVCDHLLSSGIRKVEAGCMFTNKAMLRIFKRYRMKFEGARNHHFQINDGQYSDMVMYGKLAP